MTAYLREARGRIIIGLLVAATVSGLAWAIVAGSKADRAWGAWCHSSGGTITDVTHVRAAVIGKSVTATSDTTLFCISGDGQLLGVR